MNMFNSVTKLCTTLNRMCFPFLLWPEAQGRVTVQKSWVTPHFLQTVMLIIIQCSGLLGLNELLNINSFVNMRFCILSKLLQKPSNGLVHATPPLVSAQLVQVSLPWRVGQLPQPAATLYRVYSSSAYVAVISVALLDMWMTKKWLPKKTFLSNIWQAEKSIKDLTQCLRDGSGPSTVCWSLITTGPSESVAVNKPSSRKRKRWLMPNYTRTDMKIRSNSPYGDESTCEVFGPNRGDTE